MIGIKTKGRVRYTYQHHLNTTTKYKYGRYIGLIRHTARYEGPQLAAVHFDGNKGLSRVAVEQLEEV